MVSVYFIYLVQQSFFILVSKAFAKVGLPTLKYFNPFLISQALHTGVDSENTLFET